MIPPRMRQECCAPEAIEAAKDDDSHLVIFVALLNSRCGVRRFATVLHRHLAMPSLVCLPPLGLSQGCLMKLVSQEGLRLSNGPFCG